MRVDIIVDLPMHPCILRVMIRVKQPSNPSDPQRFYGTALLYKIGGMLQLSILGVVTYVLIVARTSTPTVPTALGVPYGYAPAVTRVLGPTIAMSVTILKL